MNKFKSHIALYLLVTMMLSLVPGIVNAQETEKPAKKIFPELAPAKAESGKSVDISAVAATSAVVNILLLKAEITDPQDQPVTDNNFTFNTTADPNGKCVVQVTGTSGVASENPNLEWSLTGIVGSTLTSTPSPPKGANVTFMYTRLPSANSEFGNKTLTLTHPSGCQDSKAVQIFFDGGDNATNHPGTGSGTTPNWFYYWLQTSAGFGNPQYDPSLPGGRSLTDYRNNAWVAVIGHDANGQGQIPGGAFIDGIDRFALVCRHEDRHVQTDNVWYPNGPDPNIDLDRDILPDHLEPSLGGTTSNPQNGGPFFPNNQDSDGDGLIDGEDYIIATQTPWIKGSADSQDWSNPGHQSNN